MTVRSEAREIATRLSGYLHGYLNGGIDDEQLVNKLRWLAHHIEGSGKALEVSGKEGEEKRVGTWIVKVFEHWRRRMNKPKNTKLTPGRRKVIRARLAEGYTTDQLMKAVDACSASEFHMGQNDRKTAYNDLTLIFRNGEKLEQFLEMGAEQDPHHTESAEIRSLRIQADAAMRSGDTVGYNRANEAIKKARGEK